MKLLNKFFLLTSSGFVALSLIVILLLLQRGSTFLGAIGRWFSVQETEPEVEASTLVVKSIREASELTTAIYSIETVVPASQDLAWGDFVVGQTKLLYIAYGEVEAGIDLSKLGTDDVELTDESLTITLPPPQILDRAVDVSRSKVYDYNRGFLNLGPDVAPELQTLAQREALSKLSVAACEQDILGRANDKAKLAIAELLTLSGHENVVVETTEPKTCQTDLEAKR